MIRPAGIAVLTACILGPLSADCADTSINQAFERCRKIGEDVEKIRELNFTNEVTVKLQSKDDFVRYVESEIQEQYGDTNMINDFVDAIHLLGALKDKVNFTETLKDMMASQAAAHYDYRSKIYYLLMSDMPDFMLDVVSSHELCHALQDQHFDLKHLIMDPAISRDNGDAALARQCLAEGDATIVMTWWGLAANMPDTPPAQLSASVSLAVGVQSSMDFDMILNMMAQGPGEDLRLGALAGSIDDLKKFPRFFVESMYMAYIQGAVAVDRVRTQGGWKAVNQLFKNPPSSTEQILHPGKLIGERDEPADVRIPALIKNPPEGWQVAEEDVLGEMGTKILFSIWQDKSATNSISPATAAAGWDGDRYYFLKNKQGHELLVWKSSWDTEKDAQEFETAMQHYLKTRYPELKDKDAQSWITDNQRHVLIRRTGSTVIFLNIPSGLNPNLLSKMI